MKAFVLIKTSGNSAKKVLESVKNISQVVEANGVYGSVDIVAKLEGEKLADLVLDEIRTLPGVADTNTLIVAL